MYACCWSLLIGGEGAAGFCLRTEMEFKQESSSCGFYCLKGQSWSGWVAERCTETPSDEVASELRSFSQLKHEAFSLFFRVPDRMSALMFLFCFHLQVSICLECNSSKLRGLKRKWIRCSAQATVLHLKKFIAKKLNLTSFNEVRTTSTAGAFSCFTPPRCGCETRNLIDRLHSLHVAIITFLLITQGRGTKLGAIVHINNILISAPVKLFLCPKRHFIRG